MTAKDRRAMISVNELKSAVKDAIAEQHTCHFDGTDVHDLRQLIDIYRETTNGIKKTIIRGFLVLVFVIVGLVFAWRSGYIWR